MTNEEKELLQILIENPDFFKELQVKPEYLGKKAGNILKKLVKLYEEDNSLSLEGIECDGFTYEDLVSIIANDNSLVLRPEQDFVNLQKKLIENYKRDSLKSLSQKALNKKIKAKDWYTKLDEIRKIDYKSGITYLATDEIERNIKDTENIIPINAFPILNNSLKLCKGDLLTIGASSGLGKTSLMLNIQNSIMQDYHCIYINLEMSEPTLIKRMLAINTGVDFYHVSHPKSQDDADFIKTGIKSLTDAKLTLINGANTIEKIESAISSESKDSRHTVVFIDHIGLIQGTGKSIYERTTLTAQKLRTLCLKYGVTIIIASQLSRLGQNQDEPDITSFKDSGEIENSSRKAIVLYPDDKKTNDDPLNLKPIINLKIVKNDTGFLKTIPLIFEKTKQIFSEMS